MKYKILFAGDLHKRHKDITTIKGYVKCCDAVQDSLIRLIKENEITHFISLGDWYDRGYVDDISSALSDTSAEDYLYNLLGGNFYGVIGNHVRLKMDSNPELSLIQPHPIIKSRKPVKRNYQIMKTPESIRLGNVQISLVHHKPQSVRLSDYVVHREEGVKYHIACVHDPRFVPGITSTSKNEVEQVLNEVDFAIAGDIHNPLGLIELNSKTKMYVPGSLTNTSVDKRSLHHFINLPVVTIDTDEDTYSVSTVFFDLHTNMVTFVDKKEIENERVKTTRGNFKKTLYNGASTGGLSTDVATMNYGDFLTFQNYSKRDKDLITSVIINPNDVSALLQIWKTQEVIQSI